MAFEKTQYDIDYMRQNVIRKNVPFNRTKPDDMELLRWAESQGNFAGYVKRLIREDMSRQEADKKEDDG